MLESEVIGSIVLMIIAGTTTVKCVVVSVPEGCGVVGVCVCGVCVCVCVCVWGGGGGGGGGRGLWCVWCVCDLA